MGEPSTISFEEFGLVQSQLIELKTENYNLAENLKRTSAEWKRLGEENGRMRKELDKANKIIATSKKNQEVAGKSCATSLKSFACCSIMVQNCQ